MCMYSYTIVLPTTVDCGLLGSYYLHHQKPSLALLVACDTGG